ncbi:MAG TPA: hypothetical protein VM103_01360 [Candidatus Paceibacterota bacterium]|nr:hypothetical protein [Candidatus Paceibacterota bacterium]
MVRNLAGSQELEDETSIDVRPLKERVGLLDMDYEEIEGALLGYTLRDVARREYCKPLRKRYSRILGY